MDSDRYRSSTNMMKYLERKLVKFFNAVIRCELKPGKTHSDVLDEVKIAYNRDTISCGITDIDFSSAATRCAYVFQYSACFASTVAYHILQLLKGNFELLQRIAFQDTLNLCCLGGGPGTEIVAFAKILEEMLSRYRPTRRKPLVIEVTVIDIDSGWTVTAQNMIRCQHLLIDTSVVQCVLSYFRSDLTGPLNEHVRDIIGKSDVVTMVKFLSAVPGTLSTTNRETMLQDIAKCIKENGVLFFMDSLSISHYNAFREIMESLPDMSAVYQSPEHDLYKMSQYSIVDSVKLNLQYFGLRFPCTCSSNSVSAWCKKGSRISETPKEVRPKSETDKEGLKRKKQKHILKCQKLCLSRFGETIDEGIFEDYRMFQTKSKGERIWYKLDKLRGVGKK